MKRIVRLMMTGFLFAGLAGGGIQAQAADFEKASYDRVSVSERNYERLFGDEKLPGEQNDPELAQTMKRFVYGDVVMQNKLTDKQRQLVTVAVLAVNQNEELLKTNVKASLNVGVTPLEIRETIYQAAPYMGFPKAFEALKAANEVFASEGIKLPLPVQGTVTEENRIAEGSNVQVGIYGQRILDARANAPADQKHIQEDLAGFCFGDTYTRGTLDLKMRELITVSVIAALGGAEPQLKGHIQGNLAVGNDRETVIGAITQIMPYIGFPRTLNAMNAINQVVPAK